jgi:hypothetical protein
MSRQGVSTPFIQVRIPHERVTVLRQSLWDNPELRRAFKSAGQNDLKALKRREQAQKVQNELLKPVTDALKEIRYELSKR